MVAEEGGITKVAPHFLSCAGGFTKDVIGRKWKYRPCDHPFLWTAGWSQKEKDAKRVFSSNPNGDLPWKQSRENTPRKVLPSGQIFWQGASETAFRGTRPDPRRWWGGGYRLGGTCFSLLCCEILQGCGREKMKVTTLRSPCSLLGELKNVIERK